jgi:predicted enzyme related to lactoylglutathione lyase
MKRTINWFEIYVADFERAKNFYSKVFKCQINDVPVDNERHAEMRYATFGNSEQEGYPGGALVKMDAAKPGIGGTLVYFDSEEINTELSGVEAAGGKIVRPKQNIGPFGFIALIEDTEGNLIGLRSSK